MDAALTVPPPRNEPVRTYAPGSRERAALEAAVKELAAAGPADLTMTIGGRAVRGGGDAFEVVQPHRHTAVLGRGRQATAADVAAAVLAAKAAAPAWAATPYADRAVVLLRAADLLTGPFRDTVNAATMLGQSKSCYQAEIDAACELADFWRFNVAFGAGLLDGQPDSPPGFWNRTDLRPLDGFVLAVTPFNFTAIAGNLPTAPALMGNTVVWKPSPTQQVAASCIMRLLEAAGLPPGVVNMVTGDGAAVSEVALVDPDLAGVHFTGSTATFQHLWATVGGRIGSYRSYPRLVGETGGKDFVVAHPSADPAALVAALVRGAFEYQGQKCSAASRAYLPRSLWTGGLRDRLVAETEALRYGDVSDFANFGGAVIDRRAFDRLSGVLARLADDPDVEVLAGGSSDDTDGFFVAPTVLLGDNPRHEVFTRELFGPVLAVHVYDDVPAVDGYRRILTEVAEATPYALTGSVFAQDRAAVTAAATALRFAAGNFYVNDKPTGAVVGQQPFGGSRASGTNDKAGSPLNLLRWASPRVVKETFVPPVEVRHPHQG